MPWLKLDDAMGEHRKVKRVLRTGGHQGLAALGTHVLGLLHASRYLTDGHVEAEFVEELFDVAKLDHGDRQPLLDVLTGRGLWLPAEAGGFQLHDFLEWNPSRAEVLAEREAAAQRKAEYRRRRAEARSAVPMGHDAGRTPDATRDDPRDIGHVPVGHDAGRTTGRTPDATQDTDVPLGHDAGRTPDAARDDRGTLRGTDASVPHTHQTETPEISGFHPDVPVGHDAGRTRDGRRTRRGTDAAPSRPVPSRPVLSPPNPPEGGRGRDRATFEKEVSSFAAALLPSAPEPARTQAVTSAISWVRNRGELTTDAVLAYVLRHRPDFAPASTATEGAAA